MLRTKYERKSAIITTIILLLMVFSIINYGMTYLDPPIEYGVTINFGDSNLGNGEPIDNTTKTNASKVIELQKQKNVTLAQPIQNQVIENVITENSITEETKEDIPIIKKETTNKEVTKKTAENAKPQKESIEKKAIDKAKELQIQKPSKENKDALNSLLKNNATGNQNGGEGDDPIEGIKGTQHGNENSSNYYGTTKSGSSGNYNLTGRNAILTPKQQPNCQEEGTVVVRIQVDRSGKVTDASPGTKGTTNSARCLMEAAKKSALATKWNTDNKAPQTQIGTIIYKFTLTQ